MKDRETPLRLVRLWAKLAPDAFATLDMLASTKAQMEQRLLILLNARGLHLKKRP